MAAWRHSVTLRLALAFALLAAVVFAVLGIYLGRAADAHMAELDAHELMGKLALVRHFAARETDAAALADRLADALTGEHGVIVAVDGSQGPVFRWPDAGEAEALAAAAGAVGETPVRLAVGGREVRAVGGPLAVPAGGEARVVVARDIGHHTDFLAGLNRDFWLALLAAAALTVGVGALIARRGMRPVLDLAHTAGRISAGRLAERIPAAGVPPELEELVQAFNAMLARLEESFRRLSDFSADLAHELRTPIHALRMQTEVSLGRERSVAEYRDLLAANLEEYDRLARIIADMLFLAKADHGLVVPHREPVDLGALCRRLVEYYGVLTDRLAFDDEAPLPPVQGDALMLERAIGNLLANAIGHSPPDEPVSLRLTGEDGAVCIAVINGGPAIPESARERIFDRFVRLGQGDEGSGLGLAIARSIIDAHGGSIDVRSREGETVFRVRLSLANS